MKKTVLAKTDFKRMIRSNIEMLHILHKHAIDDGACTSEEFWEIVEADNRDVKEKLEKMNDLEFLIFMIEAMSEKKRFAKELDDRKSEGAM